MNFKYNTFNSGVNVSTEGASCILFCHFCYIVITKLGEKNGISTKILHINEGSSSQA